VNLRIAAIPAALLISALPGIAQKAPEKRPVAPAAEPAAELADSMAQRLSNEMHIKTVVGEPIKAGAVTVIPIMTLDVSFGGGGTAATGKGGFWMSGETRPLGFVVTGRNGTRFISVGKAPAK